jgi:hypothetical protein
VTPQVELTHDPKFEWQTPLPLGLSFCVSAWHMIFTILLEWTVCICNDLPFQICQLGWFFLLDIDLEYQPFQQTPQKIKISQKCEKNHN